MFAIVGGANFLEEYAHPAGAPNLGWSNWILNSALTSQRAQNDPDGRRRLEPVAKDRASWLALHPEKRAELLRDFPEHMRMFQDYYGNPGENSYWRQRGFYTAGYTREMKDVPIMFVSAGLTISLKAQSRHMSKRRLLRKAPRS
jgi:hypothetical protein